MSKKGITWFVVADGSRALFLATSAQDPTYRVVGQYESKEARLPSRELVSARPAHVQESATEARHAVEPHQDPHVARKLAFARDVAKRLRTAVERGECHSLVLYADPRTLAALRTTLDADTRQRIKAEFPKDLTKVPVPELARHFAADAKGIGH